MKKRIAALLMASAVFLSLCSCGKNSSVSVNGTKIGSGIYKYFLDCAENENPDADKSVQAQAAMEKISEYVAVNSEFANRSIVLDVSEKAELSDTVNSYWRLFSSYYDGIGVSKQDIYEIELSNVYREKLLENYYSADGDNPVTDEELKSYFGSNFIAFRAVTGFLTTVDAENKTVSLSDADRQAVIDVFNNMANEINEGISDFDKVSGYAQNAVVTSETVVIGRDNASYPEGFFDNVTGVGAGQSASFVIGDYIFTVQRYDINSEELNLFETYRADCLKSLKGEDFDAVVADWAQAYACV